MALIRWYDRDLEPVGTFDWLQRQINDLFDFPRFPETQGLFDRRVSPAIDVIEHSDSYTVECDLPGIDQKDIDISIASGVLTIKGEKKTEQKTENRKVYKKETWEGNFQRTISLLSFKVSVSGCVAHISPILPRASAALLRTELSLSFKASISG